MLDNEEINSQDRIAALENKVQKQAEELSSIKSTLSDLIKRIQSLECSKILPSSAQIKVSHKNQSSVSKSVDNHNSLKSSASSNALSNSSSSSLTKSKSTLNTPRSNLRRENSSSNRDRSQSVKSSQSQVIGASPSFNKSTGSVKFYLKGRPINLYLPNSLFDETSNEYKFDIESKITKPNETLKLEWVYGYRGKDARSNLHQLPTGEVVYFMAGVVILHNIDENTQRHYLGHTDDVKSIAIHPDKIRIATGQSAGHNPNGRAHVRIWDSINLTTLKIIGLDSNNEFQNSISCLSFSICDSGHYLAIVDEGNDRWLSVWDWNKSDKIASQKCYGDLVLCVEWHTIDRQMLITCGKQHVHFWAIDFDARHLAKRNALFELTSHTDTIFANNSNGQKILTKYEKPKYCLALVCNLKGDIIVGDSDGNILFWNYKDKDLKMTRIIKDAHEGGVFSLYSNQNENDSFSLISGGKDGRVLEWDQEFKKTGRHLEIDAGSCRCVLPLNQNASEILIGTTKNTIFKGILDDNSSARLIVNSHSDELWGLGNNSRDSNFFLTCGNDKNLNYWDSLSHTLVWSHHFIDEQPHCLDIHPQFDVVSIGFGNNISFFLLNLHKQIINFEIGNKCKWVVYDLTERKIVYTQIENGNEGFECIRYSPDGSMLACGSRDNSIYVYSVNENGQKYSRIGRCTGHSSFVTHLDWSNDSQFLMSNSGDYEILFWQAESCKQVTQVQKIREMEFSTDTCTLSFNTLGIWNSTPVQDDEDNSSLKFTNQTYDGTDINASNSSRSKGLIATVDDFGQVNLFKYPCNAVKSEKRVYMGHSSHVTNVAFVNNDLRLISIGGNDMAVFQWAII